MKNTDIKEIKINMTVENKAFLQLVCTSKGINQHQYINRKIMIIFICLSTLKLILISDYISTI